MSGMEIERPLPGEPMALDLVNTVWMQHGHPVDLLTLPDGTARWLADAGLPDHPSGPAVTAALLTAREAIRGHFEQPESESARAALNTVLDWGRHRSSLGPAGPETIGELADPERRAGWLAAINYLELLTADASRVRRCAHPECVLHFYDTSPKRSRRWCSMAGCGNRAKAARHYARTKQRTSA
ncbi:MAG TPA: CGNR zinc finger domain-containing protein [Pseudonocardia sp.]|jgi:predicted RNA-binding Zn ribbon-like protein